MQDIVDRAEAKMKSSIDAVRKELGSIRTGRASTSLVENLHVEYYGADTPLKQLANISVPEARTIVIQAYDRTAMAGIEKAILKSDLGLTPNNDGQNIRLTIPTLTEDRRSHLDHQRVGDDVAVDVLLRPRHRLLQMAREFPGAAPLATTKEFGGVLVQLRLHRVQDSRVDHTTENRIAVGVDRLHHRLERVVVERVGVVLVLTYLDAHIPIVVPRQGSDNAVARCRDDRFRRICERTRRRPSTDRAR